MDSFLTWETLTSYSTFIGMVYMVVEATKKGPFIKEMPTRLWSFIVSFVLLCSVNLAVGTFEKWDILLYILSSISISLGANGLSNVNKKVIYKDESESDTE